MTEANKAPRKRWRPSPALWIALAVFTMSLAALVRSGAGVGIPRDEAIYFEASRHQGAFWAQAARSPSKLLDAKFRDRHFGFNREHPVVMKSLAGMSARLFARAPEMQAGKKPDPWSSEAGLMPIVSERAAMRLPAQGLAALGAALLALLAFADARRRRAGLRLAASASLLGALAFIALPRVAFHATLHTFDVPIAVMTLLVVVAYRRGLHQLRWALATALLLGLAMGVKLNALFIGPLLALHYYASLLWRRQRGGEFRRAQLLPPVLVACALLAPLIALATWPWVWTDPVGRISEYVAFHGRHSYYNMEFLGANFNRPPMPMAYPWVMILATVPLSLLALGAMGVLCSDPPLAVAAESGAAAAETGAGTSRLTALRKRVHNSCANALWSHECSRHEALLYGGFALAFVCLIALPSVPIFGGTKHWLTAYPFLALLAARAWTVLWLRVGPGSALVLPALALAVAPTVWATAHGHPHNLSQYAPAVGGARGAAELGLNRGFWGYAALPLLATPLSDKSVPVYLHDMHPLAQKQYEREGMWPKWRGRAPERARAGLLFHEQHMAADEARLIQGLGAAGPAAQVRLDDVPLTSMYVEAK